MKARSIVTTAVIALALAITGAPGITGQTHAAPSKGKSASAKKGGHGGGGGGGGATCPSDSTAKGQVLNGLGQTGSDCSDKQVNGTLQLIGSLLGLVVGIAAVIAIMSAAFKYITSGGDQNKVANAKGTLLYAIIGLAVAGLTEFLIHFVLFQTAHT